MSPPTAAEGTSVLTDSPIQRIQNSFRKGRRSDLGKRTHQAAASNNTGTARWYITTAAIAHPAEAKAAPTWGAPCRMSRTVKSAAPARPSNHTVIWIFPGAFIVFETYSDARNKMRPSQTEKQLWRVVTPKIFTSGAAGSPSPAPRSN